MFERLVYVYVVYISPMLVFHKEEKVWCVLLSNKCTLVWNQINTLQRSHSVALPLVINSIWLAFVFGDQSKISIKFGALLWTRTLVMHPMQCWCAILYTFTYKLYRTIRIRSKYISFINSILHRTKYSIQLVKYNFNSKTICILQF